MLSSAAVWLLALQLLAAAPSPALSGCSWKPLGCRKDSAARLLQYHLAGCPTDALWGKVSPPMQKTAPICAPAKVDAAYCAAACNKWRATWGGHFYMGLESGVMSPQSTPPSKPDYAECVCDATFATSSAADPAGCPATCPGGGGSCGGAPGSWSINVYEVHCVPEWGRDVLLLGLGGLLAYVVGGILVAQRAQPKAKFEIRSSLHSHPHFARWLALPGLCKDGVLLSKGALLRLKAGGAGYEGVAAVEPAAAVKPKKAREEEDEDGGSGSGSESN